MGRTKNVQAKTQKIDQQVVETSKNVSLLVVTAGAIVLMQEYGFPKEWLVSWTMKTLELTKTLSQPGNPLAQEMETILTGMDQPINPEWLKVPQA